jgi:hypothetical protein
MVLAAIVACEIGFWVAILAGLSARYLARRPRLGAGLLVAAPLIDVLLLVLVAIDLVGGGTASWHHGLASLYIGISVAYGHRMIAWADAQFAHRVDGAPRPPRLHGTAYTVACWKDVARTLLAVLLAAAILGGLVLVVDAPERTAALTEFSGVLTLVLTIDLLWAVSYSIWPRKAPAAEAR